jgi:hypothetical protein
MAFFNEKTMKTYKRNRPLGRIHGRQQQAAEPAIVSRPIPYSV